MVQRDRAPLSEQFYTFQNNRTSLSDHFHDSERQSSAVWMGVIEQTTSTSPCIGREHWAVRPRLGAIFKRSGQAAFRLSDLLFPGELLQDWARHRPFDHISQAAGGQFGLAKFVLWRDSISPGQAVCSHWRTSDFLFLLMGGICPLFRWCKCLIWLVVIPSQMFSAIFG